MRLQALAAAAAEQARLAKDASEERARAAAEQKRLADQVGAGRHIRPSQSCTLQTRACRPRMRKSC